MKKRIFSMVLIIAMMFSLVACTPNMKAYMEAAKNVNEWKGYTTEGKFNIKLSLNIPNVEEVEEGKTPEAKPAETLKVDLNLPITFTGKAEGATKAVVDMKMELSQIKEQLKSMVEDGPGMMAFDEEFPESLDLRAYVDGGNIYLPKSYFELLGADLSEIQEDYILVIPTQDDEHAIVDPLNLNLQQVQYMQSAEFQADIISLMDKALSDFKPSQDLEVEGNTFKYQVGIDALVDDTIEAFDSVSKNWEALSPDLLKILNKIGIPVDEATLKEGLKDFNKEEAKDSVKEVIDLLKGSTFAFETTIDKDKVSSQVNYDVKIKDLGAITLEGESVTVKDESTKVVLPTSVKKMNMKEYTTLLMGDVEPLVILRLEGKTVNFEDQQPTIIDGRTLVPFRGFLEALDADEIQWDKDSRQVTALRGDQKIVLTIGEKIVDVNGKKVELDVPAMIVNDRTMVPVRFISETFGFNVGFYKDSDFLSYVDIYTGTEDELKAKIEKATEEEMKELKEMIDESQEKTVEKANDEKVEVTK